MRVTRIATRTYNPARRVTRGFRCAECPRTIPILALPGPSALSPFRAAQLLARIQQAFPQASAIDAQYWHFVHVDGRLTESDAHRLSGLLDYGDAAAAGIHEKGVSFLVVPRLGTISPWASKATDIAHNTGLESISRVERGTLLSDCGSRQALRITGSKPTLSAEQRVAVAALLHDRMTESVIDAATIRRCFFAVRRRQADATYPDVRPTAARRSSRRNADMGLALSDDEIDYLLDAFTAMRTRSHRCRADDVCAGQLGALPPQDLQRHVDHRRRAADAIAVRHDPRDARCSAARHGRRVQRQRCRARRAASRGASIRISEHPDVRSASTMPRAIELTHTVFKVETHNHPTAISPFPGASTGAGGEIRDEGATGRGAKPKAGLCGFSVSHLRTPEMRHAWERDIDVVHACIAHRSGRLGFRPASPMQLSNHDRRPDRCGGVQQRVRPAKSAWLLSQLRAERRWPRYGYHKPIMIAGGIGNIP